MKNPLFGCWMASLAFLWMTAFPGAAAGADAGGHAPGSDGVKLLSVQRIWNKAPHCAFTSLVWLNGRWYCAFREAKAHAAGALGGIRILASEDGGDWRSAAYLKEDGVDLRDPHLSITPRNELMLLLCRVVTTNGISTHLSATRFSKDGRAWSQPATAGDPDFWLWSAAWHKEDCYAIGYHTTKDKMVRLYHSEDGRNFAASVPNLGIPGYPNESSIAFDTDDTAVCLLRTEGPAYLGTAKPPYTVWHWEKTGVRVGGPDLIRLPSGEWLAAGRRYLKDGARTSIWLADPKAGRLKLALDLPSGGDCSYPGMVWRDGILWVSYYSSHEKGTSIYLAKVLVSHPKQHP